MDLEAIKGAVKEVADPIAKSVEAIDARLKAVEELPIVKTPAIITTPTKHFGRTISKQGDFFRKQIKNEQIADGMAKMFIEVALRKTTLAEGTDAYGGYLVPEEYAMEMVKLARASSFALQACKVMAMGSDVLKVPAELTHGSATWVGEGIQKTQSDPTFSQVSLTAKKLINLAVANNELISDADFDIASLLAEQFAYTQAQELDNQMFNGTGDPVSGVLTAKAGYSVILSSGASMSTVTAEDLSEAIYNLNEGRLNGARFFFGRLAMHYIRSLKDTTNRPIYAEIGGTQPRSIYEYPVNVTENIANTDGASKALGVFGNFNQLIIGRRASGMMIEADPYGLFDYTQTRFRMVSRWAFGYADAKSFVRILSAAA